MDLVNASNETLAVMIAEENCVDEALQQLFTNLKPLTRKTASGYLRYLRIYDIDDFFQEAYIIIWKMAIKYNEGCYDTKFITLYMIALKRRYNSMYRDYMLRNMICLHKGEDCYSYGYTVCTMMESEYAKEYRRKHREQGRKYNNHKQQSKMDTVSQKEKMTEEEKKEKKRRYAREYYKKNREKYVEAKRKWYRENRDYALLYQHLYQIRGKGINIKGNDL